MERVDEVVELRGIVMGMLVVLAVKVALAGKLVGPGVMVALNVGYGAVVLAVTVMLGRVKVVELAVMVAFAGKLVGMEVIVALLTIEDVVRLAVMLGTLVVL